MIMFWESKWKACLKPFQSLTSQISIIKSILPIQLFLFCSFQSKQAFQITFLFQKA